MSKSTGLSTGAKSAPSSQAVTKASPSIPKQIGAKLSGWSKPVRRGSHRLQWALKQQRLRHSKAPILVGPWYGEVGFEALYWLPFLAKFISRNGIDPERIMAISRGGAAAWYNVPHGFELFAMRSPEQIRLETRLMFAQQGSLKQNTVTPFDQQILDDCAETLKLSRYHVLHPQWMYRILGPYWQGVRGPSLMDQEAQFSTLNPPELPAGVVLPPKFIAVRFYARPTFPVSQQTVDFTRETITQIAKSVPVVLLNGDLHVDDHLDLMPIKKSMANVLKLSDLAAVTAQNNLAVQSAVLGRAAAFVGTYGGLAQLALRLGRPVISVCTEFRETAWGHRHLSEILAGQLGVPFHVVRMLDLPVLQQLLPTVVVQGQQTSSLVSPAAIV